jgi:poly-gamma-glutamate capsule biosynthesis protein CapA/YwtB (metallophosphatase superfamily)
VPKKPGDLANGKLQVLQVLNTANQPITQASQTALSSPDQVALHTYGSVFSTKWITIHDTAVDGTAPFNANLAAKAANGTPFKRPENGVFRPDGKFQEFYFDETGDTNATSPENACRGGWDSVFKLTQADPSANTGKLTLFFKGDQAHAGFYNVAFLTKDLITFVEDAGDTLHTQRNALDSGFLLDVTKDYSNPANTPVRSLAEGRDASATLDADNAGFGTNDQDNEITGIHVSDGDRRRTGSSAARNRTRSSRTASGVSSTSSSTATTRPGRSCGPEPMQSVRGPVRSGPPDTRLRCAAVQRAAFLGGLLAAAAAFVGPGDSASNPDVRFAFTGDLALVAGPADSYFASVRRDLGGEVVMGNLEGTLTERGSAKCAAGSSDCFAFHAPPEYARLLRHAGFTVMNLANNHALDYGAAGQEDTVAAVRGAGMLTTGRPGEIAYVKVRGTRVALVGFAPYPWAQSLVDLSAAEALVRKADRWADVVVVTMHAGAEGAEHQHVRPGTERFLGENRGNSVAFAHAVVRAGADLVVGSGPHVLRGMEWYRGRLIAYSLGNFVGYQTLNTSGMSGVTGILRVTLARDGSWGKGTLVPVTIAGDGIPRPDPAEAAHGVVRTLSKQDFGKRAMRLSRDGTLQPPA